MEDSGLRRRHPQNSEDETRPLLGEDSTSSLFHTSPAPTRPQTLNAGGDGSSLGIFDLVGSWWSTVVNWLFGPSHSPTGQRSLTAVQSATVQQFGAHVKIEYDHSNPAHNAILQEIWKHAFPNNPYPTDTVSNKWKDLGFQGDNPVRDIRGTGVFGLRNIEFLASKYPKLFRRLARLDTRPSYSSDNFDVFPFAITCFNATMLLFELLGWGWKSRNSTARNPYTKTTIGSILVPAISDGTFNMATIENSFNEIFVLMMIHIDIVWSRLNAKYMDFPRVLQVAQNDFELVINGQASTLEGVIALNSRH